MSTLGSDRAEADLTILDGEKAPPPDAPPTPRETAEGEARGSLPVCSPPQPQPAVAQGGGAGGAEAEAAAGVDAASGTEGATAAAALDSSARAASASRAGKTLGCERSIGDGGSDAPPVEAARAISSRTTFPSTITSSLPAPSRFGAGPREGGASDIRSTERGGAAKGRHTKDAHRGLHYSKQETHPSLGR